MGVVKTVDAAEETRFARAIGENGHDFILEDFQTDFPERLKVSDT